MERLANSGAKYTEENVLMVVNSPQFGLMWLESGADSAGYKHIIGRHLDDFINVGINENEVVKTIHETLLHGVPKVYGMSSAGPYADYFIKDKLFRIAFGYNGFIVSFYPIGN